ncbi:MAG: F0F1 ATP synthase subunit A [Hyphomicrobiales bacterium]|nr:F0F1 ATP synthase subunit A [Hyphomicrobiales bacterium]MCY4049781.1 F0F1 ATP synthase subunit A [Hyphomicrobiales bacterium]MCY4053126.1 F0F1 ATP synthase subunit A [Hyphomicrobiales bacterium]
MFITPAHAASGFEIDPMHQFEIQTLLPLQIGGIDISFTNSAAWMVIITLAAYIFLATAMRRSALVPGRLQSLAELSYEFVLNMVQQNAGKGSLPYFPFIYTLFLFILCANMFGMLPYAFTVTSHIAVTFAFAVFIFIGATIIGFVKHGVGFCQFFVPKGVPIFLLPLLVVIEIISYLTRPISLSVRLFANMMAGHAMLKVFAGFVGALGIIGGWLPLGFMVAFTGLEILIAFLQAYVFTILTCIYLHDALHMH